MRRLTLALALTLLAGSAQAQYLGAPGTNTALLYVFPATGVSSQSAINVYYFTAP